MASKDDVLNPEQLNLKGYFEDQVIDILQKIRLTRYEVEHLQYLYSDLEKALQMAWPGCQVHPFGSIVTGLGIKSSDADCFVSIPSWCNNYGECYPIKARNALSRNQSVFKQLFAITTAKVPILKFFHAPTGRNCDVSFKSPSGVKNSSLIGYLLHLDTRALHLAVIVKYWSKVHKLAGTNLMPNYALTLLVIFYLQQKNILPAVSYLQKHASEDIVDNWNTAFNELSDFESTSKERLYELLGGFFEFYRDFNFAENVISPFTGTVISRVNFEKIAQASKVFRLYQYNLTSKLCKRLKTDTLICIQDVFDHSRNCAVSIFPKLANRIMAHIQFAAEMFLTEDSSRFLEAILMRKPMIKEDANKQKKVPNKVVKQNKFRQNHKKLKRNIQNNFNALYQEIRKKNKRYVI